MKRELNSHIFGLAKGTPSISERDISKLGRSIAESASHGSFEWPMELSLELKEIRGQALKIEKKLDVELNHKEGQLRTLNDHYARLCEAMMKKISKLEAQLNESQGERKEQNSVNEKIESMIERHNQLVRNFENKIVHVTRVLSDQEMQLLNAQSALDEALREISRLKK
jgi:chromosome segregation ATPase